MVQLFLGATLVVLLFAGGYSIPFFDIDDEEIFGRAEAGLREHMTANLGQGVITGDTDSAGGNAFFPPIFPSYDNPFFTNPMFSPFGNIDFGFGNDAPWWKGSNVCTDRVEDKDISDDEDEDEDEKPAPYIIMKPERIFGGFQFSVNSCVEKPHKYTCKQIYTKNGRRVTLTITRQCCQGFGRPQNADFTEPCEKLDVKSFEESAKDLSGEMFMEHLRLNKMLSIASSNITLFMPTDSAFSKYNAKMFESNLVGNRRRRSYNAIPGVISILNHAVKGIITMDDLGNDDVLYSQAENGTIRINIFNRASSKKGPIYTANCAKIVKADEIVTNGIVHTVDSILPVVTDSVMDIIRKRSDMAVFRTVLEKTKLSELLENKNSVTVFAPTDKAFEKIDMSLRKKLKEGKGCAMNILKNHILDFTFCGPAFNGSKPVAYNILGESVRFDQASNLDPQIENDYTIINGKAQVTESDIMGTNGVLHVIDTVLPSESSRRVSDLLMTKDVAIFRELLALSGLKPEFDDYDNVTIFVPTDKAYDSDALWVKKLRENPSELKNNSDLRDYIRGHVIFPQIKTCDLKEEIYKSFGGSDLRINLYSTHSIFTNVMNRATVNCARLVHFDEESCGSIVHQVDKDLENPKDTLYEMLEKNPSYSKFLEAVQVANLTDLLKDNNDSYTIFLPKNEVFKEFNIHVANNQSKAESFVKEHIVNDIVCCAGITPTNWPFVRTIESISGSHLRINRDRRPKVENAMIIKCDALATNGIVHEINDVIITKKQAPVIPNNSKYDILRDVFF